MVTANAMMANQTHTTSDGTSGNVGDAMYMPVTASVMIPNGLSSVTVNQLAITSVQLTFYIANQDLLSLTGNGFNGLNGWVPTGTPTSCYARS